MINCEFPELHPMSHAYSNQGFRYFYVFIHRDIRSSSRRCRHFSPPSTETKEIVVCKEGVKALDRKTIQSKLPWWISSVAFKRDPTSMRSCLRPTISAKLSRTYLSSTATPLFSVASSSGASTSLYPISMVSPRSIAPL